MALPGTAQTSRQGSGFIPGSKRLLRALALVHDDEVHTRRLLHNQRYADNRVCNIYFTRGPRRHAHSVTSSGRSPSTAAQVGTSVPICTRRCRLCAMPSWHSSASSAPTSCSCQRATRRAWRLVRLQCTAAPLSLSLWSPCLSSWSLNLSPRRHGEPAKALYGVILSNSPCIAVCVHIPAHARRVCAPVLRGCPDRLVAHISLLATYHMTRPAHGAGTGRCCCSTGAWRHARWPSSCCSCCSRPPRLASATLLQPVASRLTPAQSSQAMQRSPWKLSAGCCMRQCITGVLRARTLAAHGVLQRQTQRITAVTTQAQRLGQGRGRALGQAAGCSRQPWAACGALLRPRVT
jgi:hypothetical protein